jgi:hypothetical protein
MSFIEKLQYLVDNHVNVRYKQTIKFCHKIKREMVKEAKDGNTSLSVYVDNDTDEVDFNLIVTYFNSRGLIVKTEDLEYSKKIKFSWERRYL